MALIAAEVVPTTAGRTEQNQLVQGFRELGLETGPVGAVSFSIAGNQDTFQGIFPGVDFAQQPAELPVSALPGRLRPWVERILFTRGYVPFT